jgi:DNA-binding MarR family transcriptional regulator
VKPKRITQSDYEQLLAFRTGLRSFLHWSGLQAEQAGLTPAQHQMLLAIRGFAGSSSPSVGDLAEALLLRHHSVVGLIDRAVQAGLVARHRDETDGRIVRVTLTNQGAERLSALSEIHLDEIRRLATLLNEFTDVRKV